MRYIAALIASTAYSACDAADTSDEMARVVVVKGVAVLGVFARDVITGASIDEVRRQQCSSLIQE